MIKQALQEANIGYKVGDKEFKTKDHGGKHKTVRQASAAAYKHAGKDKKVSAITDKGDEQLGESLHQEEMCEIMRGTDKSVIDGHAYHLKECGVATTLGYDQGKHCLKVPKSHLSQVVDVLKNNVNEVGMALAEKIQKKYLSK